MTQRYDVRMWGTGHGGRRGSVGVDRSGGQRVTKVTTPVKGVVIIISGDTDTST